MTIKTPKIRRIKVNTLLVALLLLVSSALIVWPIGVSAETAPYTAETATKLVTRCDLIKDYLSKTVRINELSARQNKVRGWEYILRRLADLEDSYGKFSVDYSELSATNNNLRKQLEQFKVDFEAYDGEFQRLLNIDCKTDPAGFWRQLDNVRSFRSGISISSENYKASLSSAISKEEVKW